MSDLPIIIADLTNEGSLLDMCRRARVVINCVGPVSTPVTNRESVRFSYVASES